MEFGIKYLKELPGCMADRATYQEALKNIEVVMHEWMETARMLDRPIPKPKMGKLKSA